MKLNLAVFILVLLLLFGCVSYMPPEEPQKNETVTPPQPALQCWEIKDREEGDRCYYNEAMSKNNLTACSAIFSNSMRDSCNLRFAINLNDSSLCVRVNSNDVRDDCYHTLAPLAGIVLCNKIENESIRRQCRIELGDEAVLCEGKTTEYDFKLCMAQAKDNYSICAEIKNQSLVDECYTNFAKSKGDHSICSSLSDTGTRDACFQYFANLNSNSSICNRISFNYTKYLCLTKLTNDYKLCNELPIYLERDSCIEIFASEHTNQSICSNISTHLYQDRCYTNIAVKSRNANICSYITCYECVNDKDSCYFQVANISLDASLCSKIMDPFNKDLCYLSIAKTAGKPAICAGMENTYRRNTCYSSIIYGQKYEPYLCADIVHQNWMDECYQKVAIDRKNSSICEKISDQLLKSNCIRDSS